MKFSTLQKGRMPAKLVDYLLQPSLQPQIMHVRKGMLRDSDFYSVGKVTRYGPELQLAMLLKVHTPEGGCRTLKALIDTGAEANLIRRGLLPSNLFGAAENPIQLVAANGQRLEGGLGQFRWILSLILTKMGNFWSPSCPMRQFAMRRILQ